MTTIRDLDVPSVEGDVRPSERTSTGRQLTLMIAVSALALTGLNVAVAVYQWRSTQELRAIDGRLQALADFEKRMKASLDGVNNGVQGRLANIEKAMQRQPVVAQDQFSNSARVSRETMFQPSRFSSGYGPSQEISVPSAADLLGQTALAYDQPSAGAPASASGVGSSYQRIELADGKVYYRRVR